MGLKRDQVVKKLRLSGCENFVGKREKFIFNAFLDLKPMERFEYMGVRCVDLDDDMMRRKSCAN